MGLFCLKLLSYFKEAGDENIFISIIKLKRILVLLTKTKKESRPLQQLNLFGICRPVESAKNTLTPI